MVASICKLFLLTVWICTCSKALFPGKLDGVRWAAWQVHSVAVFNPEFRRLHIHKVSFARFDVAFSDDLYFDGRGILARPTHDHILEDTLTLQCGSREYRPSVWSDRLLLLSPRKFEIELQRDRLANLLGSIRSYNDSSTDYHLTLALVLSYNEDDDTVRSIYMESIPTCTLTLLQGKITDALNEVRAGVVTFKPATISPLSAAQRLVIPLTFGLKSYGTSRTASIPFSRSVTFSSPISLLEQKSVLINEPRHRVLRHRNALQKRAERPNLSDADVGDDDLSDGDLDRDSMQSMMDLAASFLETTNKVAEHIKAGVQNRQIFALIIDKLLNQVPQQIGKAIPAIMTKKVDKLLYKMLSDMLVTLYVPPADFGNIGDSKTEGIANIAAEDLDPSLPMEGAPSKYVNGLEPQNKQPAYKPPKQTDQKAVKPKGITAQIKKRIATHIANAMLEKDLPEAVNLCAGPLRTGVAEVCKTQISRQLTRELTLKLTVDLTGDLSKALSALLTRSFTALPTRILTRFLTPTLTHTLSLTISHALTRPPMADYLCYYCFKKQMYCLNCQGVLTRDYYMDYYTHYYAHYYATYFAYPYSSDLANFAVDQYNANNPFS